MASFEQLTAIDPWMFRSVLSDSWISETYARDTDAITKVLQQSLSADSSTPSYLQGGLVIKPEANTSSLSVQTPSGSGSDLDTAMPRRRNAGASGSNNSVTGGKITKRKSRASKRNTTTFINADPANFRQMVQEVTGVRFGSNGYVPVSSNAPLLKPEPQRASFNRLHAGCLPTLDTSAFLLEHRQMEGPSSTAVAQPGMVADGSSGFDFGSFSSFPTLESWK